MNIVEDNQCQGFAYDFDENIPLAVVFGLCFLTGLPLVFIGKSH